MKKVLGILLIGILALSSCGANSDEQSKEESNQVQKVTNEEKVVELCDCFAKAEEEGDEMAKHCWSKLEDYENGQPDGQEHFNFVSAIKECL